MLCEFEYPGNVRTLGILIYELTTYVEEGEPISIRLVQVALAKLNCRIGGPIPVGAENRPEGDPVDGGGAISSSNARNTRSAALRAFLSDLAGEGDIILPIDLCILRRGETFKQWTARAKRSTMEAARQETGGTVQKVAERLGLTRQSLMGHLNRAKQTPNEVLFDWKSEQG